MRIGLSLLVCFISALLFSLSAKANYDAEFGLYERCKTQYKNGSCDSVAFFSKKSVLEKFTSCQLPSDIAATLESTSAGANCTNVKSISKLCADSFQKTVVQQSGSYCARASQQQAAAASASKSGVGASRASTTGGGTNGTEVVALMGAVGVPLVAAFDKKDKKTPANANPEKKEATVSPTISGATKTTSTELPAAGVIPDDPAARAERSRSVVAEEQRVKAGQQGNAGAAEVAPTAEVQQPGQLSASGAAKEQSLAGSDIVNQATEVKNALPSATPAIDKLLGVVKKPEDAAQGVTTSLTSESKLMAEKINEAAKSASHVGNNIVTGDAVFAFTNSGLQAISTQLTSYVSTAKIACTKTAEVANFLCLEGTSEGMQAAKTLMNVAGPALAVINSAQKSCSTTAKVTRMVGTAMTIAKAACVGSKLACDGSCLVATSQLKKIATQVIALNSAISDDIVSASEYCGSLSATKFPICLAEVKTKASISSAEAKKLLALIEIEATPTTRGTSQATAKQCQDHMKDIGLMALNIIGAVQAQKGAKACAEQLKAGDGTTTAEYCAQPANSVSSYCKCQKDNTQLGCSGHIVSNANSAPTNDGQSSDSRLNNGGVSGFAGPGVGGAKMDLGGVKSPIMTGTSVGGSNDPSLAKDAATAGKMGGGASAAGGGAGAAGGKNAELGGAEGAEKKKWSFGAFTSGFGGGSSGNVKGTADGTGRIGQKDLNAQRKIASEQFRAEVSEASGRSNWEKVRSSYVRKSSSLLGR